MAINYWIDNKSYVFDHEELEKLAMNYKGMMDIYRGQVFSRHLKMFLQAKHWKRRLNIC